jgi:uncharacterized membrane protein
MRGSGTGSEPIGGHSSAQVRLTAALGAGLIVLLVSLPPFVEGASRRVLMDAFSFVCHQLPDRSPAMDGISLAVCHRCYGMYWGFFLASALLWKTVRLHPAWLLASLVPATLDWGLDVVGLWTNDWASRMLTGAAFGVVAGAFLVNASSRATELPEAPAPAHSAGVDASNSGGR